MPVPGKDAKALFLGPEPGFHLPEGFEATLSLVQGFRPYFLELERAGYSVAPHAEGKEYDAVLVLAGRHRGQNELRIAEAISRTATSGLILVAGGKEDGISSLRKRLSGMLDLGGHLPKHHGEALWFCRSAEADVVAARLREDNPAVLVEGRYYTAPGMFSFDRIDTGSRLLADSLPPDIKGAVADFCAGWGYLSVEVARRARSLTALDLYEADFESMEAAKANIRDAGVEAKFFWRDLLTEKAETRYDAIVMNPPFHNDRAADPELGQGMIRAAAAALRSGGRLFLVANRGLPYENLIKASFSMVSEVSRDGAFRVFSARR